MNPDSIVIQQASPRPDPLILLFHGVGATPESMLPLGQRLAAEFANATVVSVASAYPSNISSGYQWFSVQGVTEDNRVERVAAAMPAFLAEVHDWQKKEDVSAARTALVGFSQGAIMALESTAMFPSPARCVAAISGRFATLPNRSALRTTLHLLHGKRDPIMPYQYTLEAAHHLLMIGADVTVDVLPSAGHEINAEMIELTVDRLREDIA
jgi:phospholipase/carboxylesterase